MKNFLDDPPTLGKISLNILPIPASSVPCEHLFLGAKEVATECRSRLRVEHFEQLQIMKFMWKNCIGDLAAANTDAEVVDLRDFEDLLAEDDTAAAWDVELAGKEVVSD